MKIIRHRVNSVDEARDLPEGWGAEIDLRTRGNQIILQHDAFKEGDLWEDFAAVWASRPKRGTLILNPKEDGLEAAVTETLLKWKITSYFFLDLSIPTTVRLVIKEKNPKVAIRVSEYESVEGALQFSSKADWVWVDCFSGQPPSRESIQKLGEKFQVCLVSPELHGFPPEQIQKFQSLIPWASAVCTKHPKLWGAK